MASYVALALSTPGTWVLPIVQAVVTATSGGSLASLSDLALGQFQNSWISKAMGAGDNVRRFPDQILTCQNDASAWAHFRL